MILLLIGIAIGLVVGALGILLATRRPDELSDD